MTEAIPQRLFKYVGITPHVIQQLCRGELYYANPGDFTVMTRWIVGRVWLRMYLSTT